MTDAKTGCAVVFFALCAASAMTCSQSPSQLPPPDQQAPTAPPQQAAAPTQPAAPVAAPADEDDFLKEKPAVGDAIPELVVYNPDGKEVKTSSLRGHYTVLTFGCLT